MNFTTQAHILQEFFGKTARAEAHPTGFVQRKSKLTGPRFVKTLVLGLQADPDASWEKLAATAEQFHAKLRISAQGLHQRADTTAVAYLQRLSQQSIAVFKPAQPLASRVLARFTQVRFLDSTRIELPETMHEPFRGSGGFGSRAGMKIQLVYEFLRGQYETIHVGAGVESDYRYAQAAAADLAPGSLTVQDLGYFSLRYWQAVADRAAYFVSRFQWQTAVYAAVEGACGQRLELAALLRRMPKVAFEMDVVIGQRKNRSKQVRCRLIGIPLDPQTAVQRRRKAQARAQRRGKTPPKAQLALLDWALFISNAPREWLSSEEVSLLYRLRWQVELLFKLWKSQYAVDQRRETRPETMQCKLYARLIGLMLFHLSCAPLRAVLWAQQARELSWPKALAIVRSEARAIAGQVGCVARLAAVLQRLAERVRRHGLKNRRVKHPSTYQWLEQAGAGERTSRVLAKPIEFMKKMTQGTAHAVHSKLFEKVPVSAFSASLG